MGSNLHRSAGGNALRIAVAGCGRMGRLHAERIRDDRRAQVVALFDVERAAAESVRADVAPEARVCRRFEELVQEPGLDAAVICTPTHLHCEQVLALLDRRVHVLCEKPLARTREDIARIVAAAARARTVVSIAYQRRLLACYRTLRRLVLSGRFGPVRAVASHNVENWQQSIGQTWRDDPEANPGGFIGDAGSHKIDAAFFVTGLLPQEVFARCDRCGSRVEITASVSALLSASVPLTIDFIGHAQRFHEVLTVHCAQADLTLRDGCLEIAGAAGVEPVPIVEADSSPIAGFLDMLTRGAENYAPAECALPVYEFTRGILESARTGRSIALRAERSIDGGHGGLAGVGV